MHDVYNTVMIQNLKDVLDMFGGRGVEVVYFKLLATKQDNDKNQIYLGSSLEGAANLFPSNINFRAPSKSLNKRFSRKGKPKLEAMLDFYWLINERSECQAPNTKIIDYFQYPEIRLSGFLSKCSAAPDSLRRSKQSEYGARVLCLGSNKDGKTYGYVLNSKNHQFLHEIKNLPQHDSIQILRYQVTNRLSSSFSNSPKEQLLKEIRQIVNAGWHPSQKLNKQGKSIAYTANNGGGYTLEALLNIMPNAHKAPDKYGFEIKSHKGDKISLMTPTADGGDEGKLSFSEFMNKHGWQSRKDVKRIVFTGPFKESVPKKNISLFLKGQTNTNQWLSESEIYVHLKKEGYANDVSLWSLSKLASSWEQKHAQALYIERERSNLNQYRFLPKVYLCTGTSIWNFLKALKARKVEYDPAHTIYSNGLKKIRPQWRISASKGKILENLQALYNHVDVIEL